MSKKKIEKNFLSNIENWCNHRPLLWKALESTNGDVCEMGCGYGSTPFLKEYCEFSKRNFLTLESTQEWALKFESTFVEDWANYEHKEYDVLLIDHAPGERRYVDIENLKDKAKIIVIHDSEPEATGYMLDKIWHLFKYRCDVKTDGAWATAVSNSYDVTQWKGESIADFLIS